MVALVAEASEPEQVVPAVVDDSIAKGGHRVDEVSREGQREEGEYHVPSRSRRRALGAPGQPGVVAKNPMVQYGFTVQYHGAWYLLVDTA